MEISFFKSDENIREKKQLPADIYNKFHTLLTHASKGYIFVPIRRIHYLAVIDADEVMFVDGHVKHMVVMSWEAFQPQVRESLADPVPYEQVVYNAQKAEEILPSLQGEFLKAVELMASREGKPDASSTVTAFKPKQ